MGPFDAILPAGGRISGEYALEMGTAVKALVKFGNKTVLQHTIEQLRRSSNVRRIVVIGPNQVLEHPAAGGADARLLEANTGPENIKNGIDYLRGLEQGPLGPILIVCTDLPFLSAEKLDEFIAKCPEDRDICIPICTEAEFTRRFQGKKSMYVQLAEGPLKTGSVFLISAEVFLRHFDEMQEIFKARKSKWKMASLIGFGFAFRVVTGRASLAEVQKRVLEILQCAGEPVKGSPPELAYDIDDLEDYEDALEYMGDMANWQ